MANKINPIVSQNHSIKHEAGCVIESFNITKAAEGKVNMLVAGRGITKNYGIAGRVETELKKHYPDITIFKFDSGKKAKDGTEIPSCTMNGKMLEPKNLRKNKELIWKEISRLSKECKDYIIFHVQMLGTGTDVPSLNSVVILGEKNETDLFQTMMRGCRKDPNDNSKKQYHVFIYVPDEVKKFMERFVDTLDKLGGPELIKAFSNDVAQGDGKPKDPLSLFGIIAANKAGFNRVIEDYTRIVKCDTYTTAMAMMKALMKQANLYRAEGNMDLYDQMMRRITEWQNRLYMQH